ncbi:MAG: choice-of-anchor P family protein [Thermoleophilia bacterium]
MKPVRVLVALLLGALALASVATAADPGTASGRAVGYAALLPGGTQGALSAVSGGPEERSGGVGGLRPAGGGSVARVDLRLGATTDGRAGQAEGTVAVTGVALLDGRVRIDAVRMTVRASDGPSGGSAGIADGSVSGLTVDGAPVAAGRGSRVEVPGIGALVFLEEAPDGAGGVQANALRVEVNDPAAAALIGQPFVLGHVELQTAEGAPAVTEPPAATSTAPGTTTAPGGTETDGAPVTAPPLQTAPALGLPRRQAPPVAIPANAGYVFPVAGGASFTDDYGAPRAGTGWHHGNDLFADRGTPVVAVADGTLSRVGINTLGGNRLWLTDDRGNSFYYAHLSAYAPEALEGARVHTGQVIAFVGNTGQAITTPPHLHFEIHPGDGDSVDPYPYLLAWERGTNVSKSFAQAVVSTSPVPAVGAVLIDQVPEQDAPSDEGDGLAVPVT